jgi:tripartite-type tricarboxylate transporter receptor subunit TctC
MDRHRRAFSTSLAALAGSLAAPRALAQAADDYPSKPLRWVVPFPPGGGADVVARLLAVRLSERLKQPVVVENKAGAQGNIGAEFVARSAPDGHTIVFAYAGTHAINPSLYKSMPFKESDFAPIVQLCDVPQLLVVHPSVPAKSVAELIALAKREPKRLSYSSAGSGSVIHLAVEMFKMMTGTEILHVPYKGGAPSVTAVVAGEVSLTIGEPAGIIPQVRAGALRALAVSSAKRSVALPDLPTIAEAGVPGYEVSSWNGVLAPANTPARIVDRLNAEFNAILSEPQMRATLIERSYEPVGGTPQAFTQYIGSESAKWAKVVAAAGMKVE